MFTVGPKCVYNSFPTVVIYVLATTDFLTQTFTNERYVGFHLQKSIYLSTSLSESHVLLYLHVEAGGVGMLNMCGYQSITCQHQSQGLQYHIHLFENIQPGKKSQLS